MKRLGSLVAGALLLMATAASAQVKEIGPRLGVSVDPDQFAFGGQLQVGPFEPNFMFSPNIELGVGDNITTLQFNFDVDYHFDTGPRWNPYAGGGLAIAVFDFDEGNFPNRSSDTEVGVNFIGGVRFKNQSGSNFFTELRVGVGDIPELKAMVGWNFAI